MAGYDKIPFSAVIEKRIRKLMRSGVNMTVIFEEIKGMKDGPQSTSTFYKLYGNVISEERAIFQENLGDIAMRRIEEGSDRILELALRAKAGWKTTEQVEVSEVESADEQNAALKTLMRKLGKEVDEDE